MRTARTFARSRLTASVTSNTPRMKAPSIDPIRFPFSHTSADATRVSGCIYDPLTVDPVTLKRQAFPGNIIPASRLSNAASQIAEKVWSYYPSPNTNGSGFNYAVVGSALNNYSHWDARLDHDFTQKWHSFLKVSHFDQHSLGGNALEDYGTSNPASQGYGARTTTMRGRVRSTIPLRLPRSCWERSATA